MRKVNKRYVSPIDLKLAEFDATHAKSASQLAEIAKYRRIYQLRDHAQLAHPAAETDPWQDF